MIKCSACNYENDDIFEYCIECGAKLIVETTPHPEVDARTIFCPACGKTNLFSAEYCLNCKLPLEQVKQMVASSDQVTSQPVISEIIEEQPEEEQPKAKTAPETASAPAVPEPVAKANSAPTRICPHCGATASLNAIYCPSCIRLLASETIVSAPRSTERHIGPKKAKQGSNA